MSRTVRIETKTQQGSGVRVADGRVLTCWHVVKDDPKPRVDGRPCVRVMLKDEQTDLALLEVEPEGAEVAPLTWLAEIPLEARLLLRAYVGGSYSEIACMLRATHNEACGCTRVERVVGDATASRLRRGGFGQRRMLPRWRLKGGPPGYR